MNKSDLKDLVRILEAYLDLTREPDEFGDPEENPEWEAGYQAAIAIVKGLEQ